MTSPIPSADSVAIRPATRADLKGIGRLGALLVHVHHEFDQARFIAPTAETEHGYARYLGTQLGVDNVIVLVAEFRSEVIGYSYASLEGIDYMSLRGPAGVLNDIVVDPAHRARGVGALLLDATVRALTQLGARQIVLSTAEHNADAQRLFARAGFRRTMIEMTRDQ